MTSLQPFTKPNSRGAIIRTILLSEAAVVTIGLVSGMAANASMIPVNDIGIFMVSMWANHRILAPNMDRRLPLLTKTAAIAAGFMASLLVYNSMNRMALWEGFKATHPEVAAQIQARTPKP